MAINDAFGLLKPSTYCFSSAETQLFSSGFSQVEIKNEVTRRICYNIIRILLF